MANSNVTVETTPKTNWIQKPDKPAHLSAEATLSRLEDVELEEDLVEKGVISESFTVEFSCTIEIFLIFFSLTCKNLIFIISDYISQFEANFF